MKQKHFDYILIYLPVLLFCFLLGILGRWVSLKNGFDNYTANVIFWVCIGCGILIFAFINIFLGELVEVFTKRVLKSKEVAPIENSNPIKESIPVEANSPVEVSIPIEASKTVEEIKPIENKDLIIIKKKDIEKVRKATKTAENKKLISQLKVAVSYTKEQFAPILSNNDLKKLAENLRIYAEKQDFDLIEPVKVSDKIKNMDLYHYGWNIWNFFKGHDQITTAIFLKKVFPDALKDVEPNSIRTHMKDDERIGIIVINEDISKS